MSETSNRETPRTTPLIGRDYIGKTRELVQWINQTLTVYSDKDWNYSRVRLKVVPVADAQAPYLLACELIRPGTAQGRRDLRDMATEITWGEHHSSELGILEIISLRVNKALLAVGTKLFPGDDPAQGFHPVLRLVKRADLIADNVHEAIWYEVEEVSGEEFENR